MSMPYFVSYVTDDAAQTANQGAADEDKDEVEGRGQEDP